MTAHTLIESFNLANKERRPALLTYTVGGDPNKELSLELYKTIANSGADVIEVGLSHSANVGDGPAIQDCTYRALSNGIKNDDVFEIIKKFKSQFKTEIIIMTYRNKILRYGEDKFIEKCVSSAVSGLIVVDYPFPTNQSFANKCKMNNIIFIQLIAPTTKEERLKKIIKESHEVLYLMSMSGVTGEKLKSSSDLINDKIRSIKSIDPDKKIILGFGITLENISNFKNLDACVVGSAICKKITDSIEKNMDPISEIKKMISNLKEKISS